MRPLLVEAPWGRMLVDCGVGDKMPEKARDIYALDRTRAPRPRAGRARARRGRDRRRAGHAPALRSLRRRDDAQAAGARAALPERALSDSRRRVGGRDASARAQPRQLPAGRLRAAAPGGVVDFSPAT
jgi:hypothetical protein